MSSTFVWLGLAAFAGGLARYIGGLLAESVIDRLRARRRGQQRLQLSGNWYAAWQTTVHGREVLNTELLTLKHRGRKVKIENVNRSPENPEGGYLWKAAVEIHDNRHFVGTYASREPNVTSEGTLYFTLDHVGEVLTGQWVGCNLDSELAAGYGVIARDRDVALRRLTSLIRKEPADELEPVGSNGQ